MRTCCSGESLKINLPAVYFNQKVRDFYNLFYNGQEAVLGRSIWHGMDLTEGRK